MRPTSGLQREARRRTEMRSQGVRSITVRAALKEVLESAREELSSSSKKSKKILRRSLDSWRARPRPHRLLVQSHSRQGGNGSTIIRAARIGMNSLPPDGMDYCANRGKAF